MSGPPLLPGLMDASVWMKSSYGPWPMTRPVALTMPVVTVLLEAERVADRHHRLADLELGRIAQRDHRQPARLDLDQGEIGLGIAPDDLGGHARGRRPILTRMSVAPSTTWLLVTM